MDEFQLLGIQRKYFNQFDYSDNWKIHEITRKNNKWINLIEYLNR
jgi:hypothetical protein